jgi:hypothetical protein
MTQKPKNKFITDAQANTLSNLGWEKINQHGAYLTLYPTDYEDESLWHQVCDQLNIPYDRELVTILYFATSTNTNERL